MSIFSIVKKQIKKAYYSKPFNILLNPIQTMDLMKRIKISGSSGEKTILCFFSKNYDLKFIEPVLEKLLADGLYTLVLIFGEKISSDEVHRWTLKGAFVYLKITRFIPYTEVELFLSTSSSFNLFPKRGLRGYFFHSLVSTSAVYPKDDFYGYDIFFTATRYQREELENRFYKRGVEGKYLLESGYPRIECLTDCRRMNNDCTKEITVMYAPTWGKTGSLHLYGRQIIRQLINQYSIVFRPHPMSYQNEPEILNSLFQEFASMDNFSVDSLGSEDSMLLNASLLITDWSGVAFEFALATAKPVIFIECPKKILNDDYNGEPLFEEKERSTFGFICAKIDDLNSVVEHALNYPKHLDISGINDLIFNISNGSDVICKQIKKITESREIYDLSNL